MTITVEPGFADTRLIRQTPRYYGQFSLPPRKALAFSLNWIRLIRTPVEVKLICSQPGTAIQNRKRKISMFITSVACMYSHTLVRTAEIWQIFCIFPWKHFYHWIVMTDKFYRIILASLLVTSTWWRHCLTLHFFSVNTVPVIPITIWVKETTAFPFVFIYGKCPAERAGNDIAEKLNSEIFWRSTLVWSAFSALTFLPVRTPSKYHPTPLFMAGNCRSKNKKGKKPVIKTIVSRQ